MRIGVAAVVITDLLIRMSDLGAHYTSGGIWPNHLVRTFGWNPGYWSLHLLNGTIGYQAAIFSLHLLAALSLLAGYRTRFATLLVWLLYVSLHNRNIFILQAGDDLLRLCLFWALFLPWGARYSLDSIFQNKSAKVLLLPGLGYLLLTASVYFFTALLKSGDEWTKEGSALYYALSLEQLRLAPFGDWLYRQENLMRTLSFVVYYSEWLIPFLILIPWKQGWLRWPAFLLIIMLHAGIASTLYVGLFFIISMVTAIGLLPHHVMDWIEKRVVFPSSFKQKNKIKSAPVLINSLSVFFIFLCLLINLSAFTWFFYNPRKEFRYLANMLRLNQYWGMFSPTVLKTDGWLVYHGYDSQGRQWDLRRNTNFVDYKKPQHIVKMYKNDRWRKLAENMQSDNYTFLRPLYSNYILRTWNKQHPEKPLSTLNLYYMQKENLPGYRTSEVKKILYCVSNDR